MKDIDSNSSRMKIAVCFYGKFTGRNSRGEIQGFQKAFKFLDKNILDERIDIFFHGWNDNEKESKKLLSLLAPKKYVLEKQKIFDHPYPDYDFVALGPWNTKNYINNDYSRFYSLMKSVELVDETYDLILIARFDTVFYEPIPFDLLDPNNFYVSNWHLNKEGWGFNDAWFISGSKIMKEYSLIYEKLDSYFDISESGYVRFLDKHSLGLDSLPSGHALHRYRCVDMGIADRIYAIGLEYRTWGLLRRLGQRNEPTVFDEWDINVPTQI
jgi:hypothetical protein